MSMAALVATGVAASGSGASSASSWRLATAALSRPPRGPSARAGSPAGSTSRQCPGPRAELGPEHGRFGDPLDPRATATLIRLVGMVLASGMTSGRTAGATSDPRQWR